VTPALKLDIIAAALFAIFVFVGLQVSNRPLMRADAQAVYFRGQLTGLAVLFTRSGRGPAMTAFCLLAVAVFATLRLPLILPLVMTLSQLVSQIIVEFAKTRFRRMRPDYWLVGQEAGHSYPSGHATTAIVFFTGWAVVVAHQALPPAAKSAAVALLALWSLGIMWSRLALGAHYLSDVFGGALFGGAWLCVVLTLSQVFYGILRLPG
jgi:membrane-associated phospholipid phosphatase